MNIISNTCIGAYITRDILKEKYSNPFCWNIIDYHSMKNLIEKYDNLKNMNAISYRKPSDNFATLELVDNDIKISFVHIKDKKFESIVNKSHKNESNIFINNCEKYALNKYNERIKRMKETPIFVIQVQTNHPITGDIKEFKKFLNEIKTKYKIIIITKEKLNVKNKNIYVYVEKNESNLNQPKTMAKKIGKIIKTFL